MSVSLNVRGYSSKDSKEFQKHFNAVKFCIENELSFPKETSEFFRGKVDGGNLEDYYTGALLKMIQNGIGIDIPLEYSSGGYTIYIRTKELPKECDLIIVSLS